MKMREKSNKINWKTQLVVVLVIIDICALGGLWYLNNKKTQSQKAASANQVFPSWKEFESMYIKFEYPDYWYQDGPFVQSWPLSEAVDKDKLSGGYAYFKPGGFSPTTDYEGQVAQDQLSTKVDQEYLKWQNGSKESGVSIILFKRETMRVNDKERILMMSDYKESNKSSLLVYTLYFLDGSTLKSIDINVGKPFDLKTDDTIKKIFSTLNAVHRPWL